MVKFIAGLVVGLALGATLPSIAQNPCDREPEPAWRIAPPRIGDPEARQTYCMTFPDGGLKCL